MGKLCRVVFALAISICIMFVGTASAELNIDSSYQLVSKTRVGRTAYDYTFKANVVNNGSDALSVVATVASSSQSTVVVDGEVDFGDVAAGDTVTGIDTFTIRQDRLSPFDPASLSWDIQYIDLPVASVVVNAGLSIVNIPVGTSKNVAYVIDFDSNSSGTYNVDFGQSVSPDSNGVSLSFDFSPSWTTNSSKTWVVNETISGDKIGTYELTSFAKISETGQFSEVTIIVNVVSTEEVPELKALTSSPDAISPSTTVEVLFTTHLTGVSEKPSEISVQQVDEYGTLIKDVGVLVDDGSEGDLLAADNVYSGTFTVESQNEKYLYYQVKSIFLGISMPVYSSTYKLIITPFPKVIAPSDMTKTVVDGASGVEIISNEVLVYFEEGTDSFTIESIVQSVGGTIVGSIQGLGVYQVEISGTGDDNGVKLAVNDLEKYTEVISAHPNFIEIASEVTPNDSKYSDQWGLKTIRADEAWTIARGSVLVAVVDTGVDHKHEDLSGRIVVEKGSDIADGDDDPMDGGEKKSHGTHCAGIIAAIPDNGKGVAGVSWGSKVLAVKIYKDSGGGATHANLAAGIKYAADKGAKIISYSNGGSDSKTKHDAVKYAVNKGCLFVAAAGNDNTDTKEYPGAYTEAFTVGSTTSTDSRSSFSNYGSWVNIAAPGSTIMSTIPDNKYDNKSGTSMATPMVSGAASLVWARHPNWTAAQVRERLEQTAKPLSSTLELGAGRLDVFEAVFNGSFEIGDLSEWTKSGTASSLTSLGPIKPVDRNGHKNRMGYVSTGPAADYESSKLSISFTVQPGITSFPISFDYNFITEEYPEFVGSVYDDSLSITMKKPSGAIATLATESVNSSIFTPINYIDFPGGDNTVGQTGWRSKSFDVPVTEGAGTYEVYVKDAGDDIYDSVVLIDNVRLEK